MCLLASMMLDKEMVGQVVQIIDREAFYQADHQIIYDVLVKLYEQNRPIDARDPPRGTDQAAAATRKSAGASTSPPSSAPSPPPPTAPTTPGSSARRRCCGN